MNTPDLKPFPGDMLYHPRLDVGNHNLAGALTLGYRLTDDPNDPWTRRFNGFKAGDSTAVQLATVTMHEALRRIELLHKYPANQVLAVCALPSGSTTMPSHHPVYWLTQCVAGALGWQFRPDLLSKRAHKKLHFCQGAFTRDAEVRGAYTCAAEVADLGANLVLVFDDLVTRGSTMEDAARAIKLHRSAPVIGVALGRTARLNYQVGASNAHLHAYESYWPLDEVGSDRRSAQ